MTRMIRGAGRVGITSASLWICAATLALGGPVWAQGRACGSAAAVPVGGEVVRVCYTAQMADGPTVFGYATMWTDAGWMVSYDSLWSTSLVIETAVAVEVAGVPLQPGAYAVYAVPSSFEWTIIMNGNVEHLVAGEPYDDAVRSQEVGRGLARSSAISHPVERLAVRGEASGPNSGDLIVEWGRRQVRIPVRLTSGRASLSCQWGGSPEQLAARPSPPDSLDVSIGGRQVRVCYNSPSARERRVFGGLVPYDDHWRTGANEPTIIHIPFEAQIAGISVDPGDYVLNVIPSTTEWTIVLNASTNQGGRVTPTEGGGRSQYTDAVRARELGRALVPSEQTEEHVERFRIRSETTDDDSANLILEWERTRVRIPITAR